MNKKGFMSLQWVFGILLGVLVFTAIIGTIAANFDTAASHANITGTASATLLGIGTLVVVVLFFYKLSRR